MSSGPLVALLFVAHDLDALEQKLIEAELASSAPPASPLDVALALDV